MADDDFDSWARARWGSLVRSAVFLGCRVDDAQDLAQTALLKCHVSWHRVRTARDPDAYAYRVLVNALRDSRRRQWRHEHPVEQLPDAAVADQTAQVDLTDAIHRALAGLGQDHRDVVVLRYFAHLSQEQTAEVLGVATGTVKSRLSRALAQLEADRHLVDLSGRDPW